MKILALNAGSSSLKFKLIELAAAAEPRWLAWGAVTAIGRDAKLSCYRDSGPTVERAVRATSAAEASGLVLAWLAESGLRSEIDAVGHRVVHGGPAFDRPVRIDEGVLAEIGAASALAPLHNAPALDVIGAARSVLPNTPMVASFDTAFHRTLPPRASLYAIPTDLAERHAIQRFGFHGLAHRSLARGHERLSGRPLAATRLVTLQLGAGCSAAAIEGGRSIDTSMGLTPLEGLMMATRSGDLDPALVGFLARQERLSVEEVESLLNTRSGLLGVSGRMADMRELLAAEAAGNARAALAVDMFCYRARKYLGAYLAALGGADAVVFGGGIGENAPAIRERICAGLESLGLALDPVVNAATAGGEGWISAAGSRIEACVVNVDEELEIARDAVDVLG